MSGGRRALNISVTSNEGRDSESYRKCLHSLGKVMDVVQSDKYNKKDKKFEQLRGRVMDEVERILREIGLKIFSETLMRMMIVPFQIKEKHPFATKVIDFFFDVVSDKRWVEGDLSGGLPDDTMNSTMCSMNSTLTEDNQAEPALDSLPLRILKFCEKYNTESRGVVRLRLMQTIEKIIPDCIDVRSLGRPLQSKLIRMLNTRRKDKNDDVRGVALKNLCTFYQDGLPFQNQIENELLHHMRYDPIPSVRLKVVSNITIKNQLIEVFVERAGDPNDSVRSAVLDRIAKDIPLSKLSPLLRENILKANAVEDNAKSVERSLNSLLKCWLEFKQNDPSEFLRILDVRKRRKLCRTTLDALYSESPEVAFETLSKALLSDKKYPEDSLSIETTFLWLYLYIRFKNEDYIMKRLTLPVNEMIDYMMEFLEIIEEEGELTAHEIEYRCTMLGDLLQILSFLPNEEGERQAILDFLPTLFLKKKWMDGRNSAIGVKLVSVCSNIEDETHVVNLVNAILDTDIESSSRRSRSNSRSSCKTPTLSTNSMSNRENLNLIELRQELGKLVNNKKVLERYGEVAVQEGDLEKAQRLQKELEEIEQEIKAVKEKMEDEEDEFFSSHNDSTLVEEENEAPWPYSDKTMLITMSLVCENIEYVNKVSNFSLTFYELHVQKAVTKSTDPAVRALALKLMCHVSLEQEKECCKATLFCLTALLKDVKVVKQMALKCLFDLALKYSFVKLAETPEVQRLLGGMDALIKCRVDPTDTAAALKALILSYIRHEDSDLVRISVSGVLKLLFKRDLNFERLIVNFLTNWAIPTHETRVRFKDVGVMIPVYASMGEAECIEVAQCLIKSIKRALEVTFSRGHATNSNIPHPDIDQIINLIVKCTHPSKLTGFQRPYIGHQTIATLALEEMRAGEELINDEKIQYAKLLKVLDLKECPAETLRKMVHSSTEIAETSRKITTLLEGFTRHLESLIDEAREEGEGDADNNNREADNENNNADNQQNANGDGGSGGTGESGQVSPASIAPSNEEMETDE